MQTRELPLGPAKTAREETEEGGEYGREGQVIANPDTNTITNTNTNTKIYTNTKYKYK